MTAKADVRSFAELAAVAQAVATRFPAAQCLCSSLAEIFAPLVFFTPVRALPAVLALESLEPIWSRF